MGDVGYYHLKLCCGHLKHDEWKHGDCADFTGPDLRYCLKQARAKSWLITRTRRNEYHQRCCLCPKHSGKS